LYGFGFVDPYRWITDTDPDTAFIFSDIQDANKKLVHPSLFYAHYLNEGIFK
jgi:hypothetical protein